MTALAVGLVPRPHPRKRHVGIIAHARSDFGAARNLAERLPQLFSGPAEEFGLSLRYSAVKNEDELLAFLVDDGLSAIVLVSPDLVVREPDGQQSMAPLVNLLRVASAEHRKPIVLLAMANAPGNDLTEVDACLPVMPEQHEIANTGAKLLYRLKKGNLRG